MTAQEDRQKVMEQIEVACREGARLEPACEIAELDVRTVQRWRGRAGKGDGRPQAVRPTPAHALSEAERARLLEVANEPRFADMPPARIVPALADEGQYLASESSFSRVLHSDNGATLKATSVLALLHWLQIRPSYSRPRVSDDNAFVESLFRTAKYRPEFPASGGFQDLQAARQWASAFVHWYNHDHRQSGINYVSPAQRHAGQDREILAARELVYQQAREANPKRWSGKTRDWSPVGAVTLNPERESVTAAIHNPTAEISAVAA